MGIADITVAFAVQAIECVRAVSTQEILPRFRGVTATRKLDGSLVTEADIAAQRALATRLARIARVPVLGEGMPGDEQPRACPRFATPSRRSTCAAATRTFAIASRIVRPPRGA